MALFIGLSTHAFVALQHKKNMDKKKRGMSPVWTENHTSTFAWKINRWIEAMLCYITFEDTFALQSAVQGPGICSTPQTLP